MSEVGIFRQLTLATGGNRCYHQFDKVNVSEITEKAA